MKYFFTFLCFTLLLGSCGQTDNKEAAATTPTNISSPAPRPNLPSASPAPDVSPMDVIYFPVDYPLLKMSQKAEALPVARVFYSRPHKQGRKIFGALIPFKEPWRLGANEATEIELFRSVTIQGKSVAAGRYVLYCIPEEAQWIIVFNTNTYSWGLKPDPSKDVHHFVIPAKKIQASYEYFTMLFENAPGGANLSMWWDDVTASLPITL